jgi:hypothetical protein
MGSSKLWVKFNDRWQAVTVLVDRYIIVVVAHHHEVSCWEWKDGGHSDKVSFSRLNLSLSA